MCGLAIKRKSFILCLTALLLATAAQLCAQATVLLEEPYSYDGTFAGTGHTAIYLSRVCAETPTQLRRCAPGETAVVISRYHGIARHDWIAIPLIPYLYAVKNAEDVPLYVDTRLVALLRERYLSTLPLPPEKGNEPRYELAGSAYNRTLYGFQFATTPEQDDALIRLLNAMPNDGSYELVKRNCADFVKEVVDFYYPKAVHRSVIADLGVMTPKQAAKSLVRYSKHHPEMRLTTFIIPQVPGLKRSKPVHGVIESVVLAKKYVTPVLLFHPFLVGGVEAAYWAGWRFNPTKGALIFDPAAPKSGSDFQLPLTASQRKSYQKLVAATKKSLAESEVLPGWQKLEESGKPQLDARGQPLSEIPLEGWTLPVGLCRGNALHSSASPEVLEQLMLARLQVELKPGNPPRISEQQVKSDWQLFQAARGEKRAELRAGER
jgi:hypothetical protein